ncbi:hypothetical protein FGLOB1_3425 [Fusarium globosum]|uniref:Uncharacterized protein n=1 Tax=Fusarium globosum TaxID=78864 RepID=A0A8H5YL32_9HYPO|nr:hypothetical protein FGLOB1_3425 [Fusarium globosum]
MTAPRRSKRIQALNQTNEGSQRATGTLETLETLEALEAPRKHHPQKRRRTTGSQREKLEGQNSKGHSKEGAPKEQATKEETPVVDPAARWAELEKKQADKAKEQHKENRRKIEQSRIYLHEVLALDRKDGYAQQFWGDLARSIKCLADESRFWDKPWDSLEEDLQQKFLGYAPNIEELFDVPDMAPLVFQRWLWEVIDENFFSKKSKDIVWASPYWEAQGTLERYLQEHDFSYDDVIASHMFPHWRYTTMQFYLSLKDSPRKSQRIDPACVVPITAKAIGQYFPQEPEEESMKNEYSTTLQNLSDAVVKMDFFFSANLTVFSHVFHHPTTQQTCGFPYSPKLEGVKGMFMKAIGGSDAATGRTVDLVVEPMLQRRGDPLGFDYNVKTAVHPMKVCVAWLEAHRNQPDSPEVDGEEEHGEETDDATAEGKSEEHGDDDSEDEEGKEVEGLIQEGKESREEVDKEEDNNYEEDKGIMKEGKKNNKNKERADDEVEDKGVEEDNLTKQEDRETNTKEITKSKKKKKN